MCPSFLWPNKEIFRYLQIFFTRQVNDDWLIAFMVKPVCKVWGYDWAHVGYGVFNKKHQNYLLIKSLSSAGSTKTLKNSVHWVNCFLPVFSHVKSESSTSTVCEDISQNWIWILSEKSGHSTVHTLYCQLAWHLPDKNKPSLPCVH